jgi:hypothetical protein
MVRRHLKCGEHSLRSKAERRLRTPGDSGDTGLGRLGVVPLLDDVSMLKAGFAA